MSQPILVGYDPRSVDGAPVDFAVALARLTGARLILACVQAASPVVPLSVGQSQPYAVRDPDLGGDCADRVNETMDELRRLNIPVDERIVASTSAARALHKAAADEDAGLLVVGSARRGDAGRVRAGSTAQRLLHGAPCPVALVPLDWTLDGAFSTIGVGYAGGDEGDEALRGAHALARRAQATLHVIIVVDEGSDRADAEREVRQAAEAVEGDVQLEVEVSAGDPAAVLVRASERLDLLVCGSRGYGPLRAVLLGSVSGRVAAEASCPLIVVPRGVRNPLDSIVAPGVAARA